MPLETLIEQANAEIEAIEPSVALADLDAFLVVDVREPNEVLQGYLAGAVNVPRGVLEFHVAEDERFRSPERKILVYSNEGQRAALAACCLKDLGYTNVVTLKGGIEAWAADDLPVY